MDSLREKLFIFTTSSTGLGHIRVMNAVEEGKPSGATSSFDMGIANIKASKIHEIGSKVLPFIKLTEFYQTNPIAEALVTAAYTLYLRRHVAGIVLQFEEIKAKFPEKKEWIIISTHFALAHSIGASKQELEKKFGVKIYLCVVVTDDSPQRVWVVPDSDITFVPSQETRNALAKYFPESKRNSLKMVPFPIAPRLTQNLTAQEFQLVIDQLDPNKNVATQIEIPISGAAVQLDFFSEFINILCRENYEFTATGVESFLTKDFFEKIRQMPRVQTSIGKDMWQTVEFYQSLFYQAKRPAIEITKPSEQAFKAILTPRQRGGVILLLTQAVGRQEYDNLAFLGRNELIPTEDEHNQLYNEKNLANWCERAKHWRAIKIPKDPVVAANFVKNLKSSGVFYAMLSYIPHQKPWLASDGVSQIWDEIKKLV